MFLLFDIIISFRKLPKGFEIDLLFWLKIDYQNQTFFGQTLAKIFGSKNMSELGIQLHFFEFLVHTVTYH